MATTDAEILELYRVSLTNAASQPAIAQVLDEFGYGPEKLAEGRAKLDDAFAAYHGKGVEDNETSAARHAFDTKKDQLAGLYALDRRKAKAVFRKEPLLSDRLKVDGSMPRTYMKWLETVRTFYAVCLADPELQKRLLPTKITPEYLGTTYALITELEAARADYIREKGECNFQLFQSSYPTYSFFNESTGLFKAALVVCMPTVSPPISISVSAAIKNVHPFNSMR